MILTWDNPRNDQLHLQHIIGNGMRHHHFDSMIILVLCIIWLLFQFRHTKSANDFTFMKHLIWIYIMNIMDLHYEFIKTITDKWIRENVPLTSIKREEDTLHDKSNEELKWTHSWERDCGGPESMWCSGGPETIWTTTKNKKVNPKEPSVT